MEILKALFNMALLGLNPNGKCQTCGGMWGEHIGNCPRR